RRRRLRGDRDRPPGTRRRARRARRAARGRLPRRHARHRGGEPGPAVRPVSVGVVGLGYWGPNLARNFDRLAETELRWICDASDEARERWAVQFPRARVSAEIDELLADAELDAVVIAAPVPLHADLAVKVLAAD